MRRPRGGLVSSVAGVFALLAAVARAQSYGPNQQVLTIGAAEFKSREPLPAFEYLGSDQYLCNLYSAPLDFVPFYLAPLALPDGALMEEICLYANDSGLSDNLQISLLVVKLTPGGESPETLHVGPNVGSTHAGYGRYCQSFSETMRSQMDVGGDGIVDNVVWYVMAILPHTNIGNLCLGGVQIRWRRQVSPPPATPTFGDVPTSDPAFRHIEALFASGITAGCGSGNYCPDATLTRRQMAVFLAKALGLHWPY